jgi:membrane fusion protein, multidrug efflux system
MNQINKNIPMKAKKLTITIAVIVTLVIIIAFRLVSNKKSMEDQLKMASEFNTTIPVIVDTAKYEQVVAEFKVNGTFEALREISILSETQGKISSISSETGDKVSVGQTLASVDVELCKSQLDLAKFNLEKAEKDMQRYEQLSKGDAISAQQYEGAKQLLINSQAAYTAAKIQYQNSFIKAPFNGIITKQYIEKGTFLMPGTPVFDIVEISKMKFVAKLTDVEIEKIKKEQAIKVSVDAYPGYLYDGIITAIVVKADQSKRYDVEIEINNRIDKPIKPGMFGTALISPKQGEETVIIPRKAIAGSIKNPQVFIVKGDSVILQSIDAQTLDNKNVVVSKGINAGDVIVISGQINLENGTKIKID